MTFVLALFVVVVLFSKVSAKGFLDALQLGGAFGLEE
jgi:hypothetical protein